MIRLIDERGLFWGFVNSAAQLASEKIVQKSISKTNFDWVLFRPNDNALKIISQLVDSKKIKPVVDNKEFIGLETTVEAHKYYELGQMHGKVVIDIG